MSGGHGWSKAEEALLRQLWPTHDREYIAERLGRSSLSVKSRASKLKLRKENGPKRWTEAELEDLRRLYPDCPMWKLVAHFNRGERQIYGKAHEIGLRRSDAYLASPLSGRTRPGSNIGGATRFKPGHTSWNKGRRFRPGDKGYPGERGQKNFFRKGNTPHTHVPVGTEVVDPNGYHKVKVSDDRSRESRFNWKFTHVKTWEEANGRKVPRGYAVVFRDGDKNNCKDPDNLELVSRQELMRRNTIHNLPKPLADVCRLKGAVNRQIKQRSKQS